MSWGVPNRPKVTNRFGKPTNRDGGDGDIQIKGSALGAKLFARWSGRWWDIPLSINGVTKFGVTDSDYLSIDRDSVDIYKESKKVASFGETVIIGEIGASKSNVQITSGAVNLRTNTVNKVTLDTSGNINLHGKIIVGASDGSFNDTDNINIGSNQSGLGVYNISIGFEAGEELDASAIANILIGFGAGKLIDSGGSSLGYNTCVGTSAGSAITTGVKNVFIGNSTNTTTATVSNQIAIGNVAKGNGAYAIAIGDNITASGNDFSFGKASNVVTNDFDTDNAWSRSSDVRLKTNIQDIAYSGLDFINELRPITFEWKRSQDVPQDMVEYDAGENHMTTNVEIDGMIAQEVKTAMDKCNIDRFGGWKLQESGTQSLSREAFVYPLIKAIQELSAKLDTIQTEINNLKAE